MVYAPKTGIKLPGTSDNYISTPDHADLDIVSDLCLVMYLTWPGKAASQQIFISKSLNTGDQRSWFLGKANSQNVLQFYWTDAGTDVSNENAQANVAMSTLGYYTGSKVWLALTFVPNDSNGDAVYTFFEGGSGSVPVWSKIGDTIKDVGAGSSIYESSADLMIGMLNAGSTPQFNYAGTIYSAQIYNGVGDNSAPGLGTLVAEFDASKCKPRYRDSTGKIWTLNGSDSTMEKV